MKGFWDSRYRENDYAYGTEVNAWIAGNWERIPRGPVLCLAEGQGRNAVFLAGKGLEVYALDQSEVGLSRARELAEARNVEVQTISADLANYPLGEEKWGAIAAVAAHFPPDIRKRLHFRIADALKPGGIFLMEGYSSRQSDMPGTGGPAHRPEMLYTTGMLREELPGMEFIILRDVNRKVDEGPYHQGLSAVIQVLAVKRSS